MLINSKRLLIILVSLSFLLIGTIGKVQGQDDSVLYEIDEVKDELITRAEYGKDQSKEGITACNFVNYIHLDILKSFHEDANIPLTYKVFPSLEVFTEEINTCDVGTLTSGDKFNSLIAKNQIQKLDYRQIPNITNIPPQLRAAWLESDPEGYGVPFSFGPMVISVREPIIKEVFGRGKVPRDAAFYLEPENLKKLKDAGYKIVTTLQGSDVISPIYIALGLDPNSSSLRDLEKVNQKLQSIKPYIDGAVSGSQIPSLMDEQVALGLFMYDGDVRQAQLRLQDNGNSQGLTYFPPQEGAYVWFDFHVIPQNSEKTDQAYAYINHFLTEKNAALFTKASQFSNTVVGVPDVSLSAAKSLPEDIIEDREAIWNRFMDGIPKEDW
jgi:spermidine/putrescine-binding protein